MKKRIILSAVLTMVLCFCLIGGATFALFTSESSVNIAVTSGKVNVEAKIEGLEVYSMDVLQTATDNNGNGLFENGGTAKYDAVNNVLTLDKAAPGDKVVFNIVVTNNSNIDIQYRVTWKATGELEPALKAYTYNENNEKVELTKSNVSWTKWVADLQNNTKTIKVEVELPIAVGDEYQEKAADISFALEAVQGNVTITDFDKINNSVFVNNYDSLFYEGIYNDYVVLLDNIQTNSQYNLYFGPGDITNIDLNGKTVILENINQFGLTASSGGKLVLDGDGVINCGKGFYSNNDGTEIVVNSGTINMTVSQNINNMATHSIIQKNAKVVINGGTFTSNVDNASIFQVTGNGRLEVNGGFFVNTVDTTPDYFDMATNKNNVNRVVLTGGTFVNWNPLDDRMCYTGEWPEQGEAAFGGPFMLIPGDYKVVSEIQTNGDVWYSVVKK